MFLLYVFGVVVYCVFDYVLFVFNLRFLFFGGGGVLSDVILVYWVSFIIIKVYVIIVGRNGVVGEGLVGDYLYFFLSIKDLKYFSFKIKVKLL